jgi:hypothetical protein
MQAASSMQPGMAGVRGGSCWGRQGRGQQRSQARQRIPSGGRAPHRSWQHTCELAAERMAMLWQQGAMPP